MCHQHTNLRVKIPPLFLTLPRMNPEQVGDPSSKPCEVVSGTPPTPLAGEGLWGVGGISFCASPPGHCNARDHLFACL